MSHTSRDKQKLLNRIRRIRGQVEAVEHAVENERECEFVLQTIAACRGAMSSLMIEILQGHVRFVVANASKNSAETGQVEYLVDILKAYMK